MVVGTLLVTVVAMVIGVGLGVVLAVMRLSDNPVLTTAAFVFLNLGVDTYINREVSTRMGLWVFGLLFIYPRLLAMSS